MPTLDLNLSLDITPITTLELPNDGKVVVKLQGAVDVPEPLLAQQIWDAARAAVEKGRARLQASMDKAEAKGASADKIQKYIDKCFDYIEEKAAKKIQETISAYLKMHKTYKIVQKQDVAKTASTGTKIVLNIVRLVISGGMDIAAWSSLGKTPISAAKYMHKALVKIEEVDDKTRKSVTDANTYYREKVMKGKEGKFAKFKKLFSDPMKKAKTNVEDMQKRLARAEDPCHQMSAVIQQLLEKQDAGETSPKVEAKLNKLLFSVSNTMERVTPANASLKKQFKVMTLLEKDLKVIKEQSKKGFKLEDKQEDSLKDKMKKLKKQADDNGIKDWVGAARTTATLAKELAALL